MRIKRKREMTAEEGLHFIQKFEEVKTPERNAEVQEWTKTSAAYEISGFSDANKYRYTCDSDTGIAVCCDYYHILINNAMNGK